MSSPTLKETLERMAMDDAVRAGGEIRALADRLGLDRSARCDLIELISDQLLDRRKVRRKEEYATIPCGTEPSVEMVRKLEAIRKISLRALEELDERFEVGEVLLGREVSERVVRIGPDPNDAEGQKNEPQLQDAVVQAVLEIPLGSVVHVRVLPSSPTPEGGAA